MARITGAIATSHVPAIGAALDMHPAGGVLDEHRPGLGEPLLQPAGTPVLPPLGDLVGGEEEGRLGAGQGRTRHHGDQHEQRADERVEEELEARIDAALAAPHADDEEHRNEAAFEEDVEQDEVQRAEHADHQRLQHEEADHVFLHAVRDGFP